MSRDIQWPAPVELSAGVPIRQVDEELQRYDTYLRDLRGLSPGSRKQLGCGPPTLAAKFWRWRRRHGAPASRRCAPVSC